MAIKLTVTAEPTGDEKATLRMTHTSAEEGQEPAVRETVAGQTPTVNSEVFELQKGGKLEIQITKITMLKYDKDQASVVEVADPAPEGEAKKEDEGVAAHGPKSHAASGAKESANTTHEGRAKR